MKTIDFKKIVEGIDKAQRDSLVSLADFRGRGAGKGVDILASQSRGLYWLWCRTDFKKTKIALAEDGSAHVPINKLLSTRSGLDHICKEDIDGFTVVYNGMGGYKKWKKASAYGLRGRINQECVSNNTKTGTLNIEARGFDLLDWNVSFFDFDDKKNHKILKLIDPKLDILNLYTNYANTLEILWRLHYGTPIFCRY